MSPRSKSPRGTGRYRQWRECMRKKRFDDEHGASRRACELGINFYECPHCDGWHISRLPYMTSRPAQMPRHVPEPPPERVARMCLSEAERVLAKLYERKRAGVELPAAMIEQARERLSKARELVEKLRKAPA
jgi:hypothetical protein